MSTKANWPEDGLLYFKGFDGKRRDSVFIHSFGLPAFIEIYNADDISELRARQICALPKMVELLKEISEQTLFFEDENHEYEVTDYHHDATAILREIGEIE